MLRHIDAPDSVWSTAEEAAKWLGLNVKEFRMLVRQYPLILKPNRQHKQHRWHWLDLAYYAACAGKISEFSEEICRAQSCPMTSQSCPMTPNSRADGKARDPP